MSAFQQYQSFFSPDMAQPLLSLLREHNIPFESETFRPAFDVKMAFNATDTRYLVRVRPADFEAVRQLEDQASEQQAPELALDHYLLTFTDDELFEILVKPEEWSRFDVVLAGKLLRERGRDVSPDALQLLRRYRTTEMARPEPSQKALVLAGYLLALLGGLIGIVIGLNLQYHQKTLLDGRSVPAYSAADRVHGFRIVLLGFVVAAVVFGLRAGAYL